jgi:opacity protein-like surface antigen
LLKGTFMHIRRSALLGAFALATLAVTTADAQARRAPRAPLNKIELTGYVGYQFGLSTLTFVGGNVSLADNMNYGGSIGIRVKPQQFIEFTVNRWDTELRFRGVAPGNVSTAVTNFYLGGYQEIPQGNIRPFFGFGLGATWFSPNEGGFSDDWRFSFTLGGGVKIWLGEAQKVGIRLGANLLTTFLSSSWGGYCGTSGCGLGLFGTGVADLNFTAGLTLGLGDFWN